jgi:glycosyltransferase involved in cell wall biosynthesis
MEKLQIIVAADGSDDDTPEIVKGFEQRGVELSYQPERRGKMAAINRAMSKVRHEIVIFSDANNLYARETLRVLVSPFSDPKVGGVSGSKNILGSGDALTKTDGLYWRYESYIKEQETLGLAQEFLVRSWPSLRPVPIPAGQGYRRRLLHRNRSASGHRLVYAESTLFEQAR